MIFLVMKPVNSSRGTREPIHELCRAAEVTVLGVEALGPKGLL